MRHLFVLAAALAAAATPTHAQQAPLVGAIAPQEAWNDADVVVVLRGSGLGALTEVRLVPAGGGAPVALTRFVGPRGADRADVVVPAGTPRGAYAVVAVDAAAGPGPAAAGRLTVLNRADPDVAGDHLVGTLDGRLAGPGGARAVRVYYPATRAGVGAPGDPRNGPHAVVAWGHAFKPFLFAAGVDHRNNAWIARWLASFGYVVVCPDLSSNTKYFGADATGQANSSRDAEDLLAALAHATRLGNEPTSPLFGLVDAGRAAVGGHSRGGDAALMAGARDLAARGAAARVRAVVALSPPSTDSRDGRRPLRFGDLSALPVLLLGGSADRIAPFAEQRAILALAGAGSAALELAGANHSQFKDSAQRILSDGQASMSLAAQHAAARRYVTAWLNRHVRDELRVAPGVVPDAARRDARVRAVELR
ncbi:MAG: dienelactone hydrolase family protein [Planctomycetes bacterium]|nr:dienelactone hydrolase family protein [Planctomycetota bacterium]